MKKIDKITTLGKMMLKDKITSSWDKLLTEKPQGDLMGFYKKRLEHFWRLPDLEKIIGKEKAASAYAAMEGMALFLSRDLPGVVMYSEERGMVEVRKKQDIYKYNCETHESVN